MNSESQQKAEGWIRYFGESLDACIRSGDGNNIELWQKGVNVAKEWHGLIVSEIVPKNDLLRLMGIVHANKYRNSVWHSFALEVYDWAVAKEIPLLPHAVFFKYDGLRRDNINELAKTHPLKNAQTLYEVFHQYSNEDPNTEAWEEGLKFAEEWIRVLKSEKRTASEILALLETVSRNFSKFTGVSQWLDTMLAVGYWCKSMGQQKLIPRQYRLLFEEDEAANS